MTGSDTPSLKIGNKLNGKCIKQSKESDIEMKKYLTAVFECWPEMNGHLNLNVQKYKFVKCPPHTSHRLI